MAVVLFSPYVPYYIVSVIIAVTRSPTTIRSFFLTAALSAINFFPLPIGSRDVLHVVLPARATHFICPQGPVGTFSGKVSFGTSTYIHPDAPENFLTVAENEACNGMKYELSSRFLFYHEFWELVIKLKPNTN